MTWTLTLRRVQMKSKVSKDVGVKVAYNGMYPESVLN
jgi:hypothetical protein